MAVANGVDVCNLALDHLGKPNITSLTEGSNEAIKCSRQYPIARRIALSRSPWTFARKMQALAVSAANALSDTWDYCYDLPSDTLKFYKLIETAQRGWENDVPFPMYIASGKIFTNLDTARGMYTYDNTVTLDWSDQFADTVALALATRLAPSMTRRRSDVTELREAYIAALADAIEHDAAQDVNGWRWGDGYADSRDTASLTGPSQADGSSMWG